VIRPSRQILTRRALQLNQRPDAPLYLFTLAADEILRVADFSRLSRDQGGELIGYQRQEVRRHVQEIADYLKQDHPLFPNALIMALSSVVRFTGQRGPKVSDGLAVAGTIEIPLPVNGEPRPAWIVDGQQRALALADAANPQLPIPVSGFIADSVSLQRDQFIRVNSAKPLPRRLVDELLPELDAPLPARLAVRQLPSALVDALNTDDKSPFHGLIKRESIKPGADRSRPITDTSLVEAIRESLRDGCLALYRDLNGRYDHPAMWSALITFWTAVKEVFPDAWGRSASESRLMHGVGIRAMSKLMDRMMGALNVADPRTPTLVREQLLRIAPSCHWTSGRWEALGRAWDQLQNTPQDIQLLAHYLIRVHVLGEQ
jgi:DGQHR domain-containing protein